MAASVRPRSGALGHRVLRDGRRGRAWEGELSDPEAAAAHAEALGIPEAPWCLSLGMRWADVPLLGSPSPGERVLPLSSTTPTAFLLQ